MRFLKADKLFDGRGYLADNSVLVLDDRNVLNEIIRDTDVDFGRIERLKGIITPGFVNAHCHLELSHLKGKIPKHTGLPSFAGKVISLRNTVSKEEVSEHMEEADRSMWNNGIVVVGDISNSQDSFNTKSKGKIYYHTFIELIGLNPAGAESVFGKGKALLQSLHALDLPGSLAPHAPYSTSKELIKLIGFHNSTLGAALSIHNQESAEETLFFAGEKNGFDDLYRSLGLDLSWYRAPGISSLMYYLDVLPVQPSVLVHNTFTGAADINEAANKNIFWCFCPGANTYIENRLPDFSVFNGSKSRICIGTDSLASNTQLDVVAEANLILNATKIFSEEDLLRALTSNGAEALGVQDKFGHFIAGKNTGLNLLTATGNKMRLDKKIA